MTDKEKIELVYAKITESLKQCRFTFEGLAVEIDRKSYSANPVIIRVSFILNEEGNANQTL